jgi:hypothetical protein
MTRARVQGPHASGEGLVALPLWAGGLNRYRGNLQ